MDRRHFLLLTAAASSAIVAPAVATPWPSDVMYAYRDILFEPDALVLGAPEAGSVLVEFFDYQCPQCRKMHGAIERLTASDSAVRIVCKEWPTLGDISDLAARAAIAAHFQGRYAEAHAALMRVPEPMDENGIVDALTAADVDVDRVSQDLRDKVVPIERRLRMTRKQAAALHLAASPGFVAGKTLLVGVVDERGLRRLVRAAKRSAS